MSSSTSYLDRFRSALPKVQGNQILKRLTTQKDNGEIRTLDEFKVRLKELTAKLLEERLQPTMLLYQALPGEDISSEQYNDLIEHVQDDLESAFAESDNLDAIITAHHNLIQNVALKVLRFGINELESKLTFYEFISRSGRGFDNALFNTFRASQNLSTSRSDNDGNIVYIDPRRNELVPIEEDSLVDIVGERLMLGTSASSFAPIIDAEWLSNPNSVRSELDVSFENSSIQNVIDGTNNTYWVTPLLFDKVQADGVLAEIAIVLAASQDLNFIDIEPAVLFPVQLTQIDYFDSNNERKIADTTTVVIDGPTRINFSRITTGRLILRFKQKSYRERQFTIKPGTSNFHRALLKKDQLSVDINSVSEDLREILSSDYVLTDILNVSATPTEVQKYWEYLIGFDNIKPGFHLFNERSIFVSTKKEAEHLGQLGLKVEEHRPVQIDGETAIVSQRYTYPTQSTDEDRKFYHGSVEYWVVLKYFSNTGALITTETIPILPIGAKRIYHEQLLLTHKSSESLLNNDQGSLIFFTNDDSDDVKVYRNGFQLVYSTQWEFIDTSEPELTIISPSAGARMKRGIKILSTVDALDIYTASYTPVVSNTTTNLPEVNDLFTVVDLSGDENIRLTKDNLIVLSQTKKSQDVGRVDTYLKVIMRRNSANDNFSPKLEEYMLVTGVVNDKKFLSDVQ